MVKGFGRGSKELGIPTANLDSASLQSALAEAVTGIYCGWSSIGNSPEVYPMVSAAAWSTLQASWRCATRAGCQATMRLPASKPPSSCMLVCLYPARGTGHCSLRVISALQVMSVGWNPFFKNESKTCEPWLLHKFDNDFYDKELR